MSAEPTPLDEADVASDPLAQFRVWFSDATHAGEPQPEAAAMASADVSSAPSVRMVLVKAFDAAGFVFYTNFESRKARELEANPQAALLFHWQLLGRQVRVEGPVERVSPEETARYVRSRPRRSQLSALASPQSQVVPSRRTLEQRVAELSALYENAGLPLPETWGGFRVRAHVFEFWQHRPDRLHDRLRYVPAARDGRWRIERLGP